MISLLHDVDCLCRYEETYVLVFSRWITFFCNSIFWALHTAILNNTLYHLLITHRFITGTHTHTCICTSFMNHIQYVLSFSAKPYPVPLFHSLWVLHTWTHMLKSVRLFNYNCALNAHHTLLNDRQGAGEQSIFFRQLFFQLFLTHVYLFLFCLLCWFSRPFILGIEEKKSKRPYLPSKLSRYSFFFFLLSCADCLFRIFLRIFFRIFSSY